LKGLRSIVKMKQDDFPAIQQQGLEKLSSDLG
jgi:hypothetical protein